MKLTTLIQALLPDERSDAAHPTSAAARIQGNSHRAGLNMDRIPDVEITTVDYDSRRLKPGGLFVAIPGFTTDGHDHIGDALARGAVAVIVQRPVACDAFTLQVENTRMALASVAAQFYGHPSRRLHITGITGTNGKTTTAYLIENLMAAAGMRVGVIGTVNCRYDGKVFASPVTTPESLDLQRILAEMEAGGISHVVMEVSSHAIELFRIHACDIRLGVFTNLSQDHLDFHGDMESYWRCKKKLFTHYLKPSTDRRAAAVVNIDHEKGVELVQDLPFPCVTTGRCESGMVRPRHIQIDLDGTRGEMETPKGRFSFRSHLVGAYNLENILNAAGAGIALDLPLDAIKAGIESTTAIPGRLEYVSQGSGKSVVVDFAHTPDALQNVLQVLRRLNPKRLICVFGCGGDRDKTKRPQMGEIAGKLCDLVIVTSDNPRTEPPADIIDQIIVGVKRFRPKEYALQDIRHGFTHKGYAAEADRKLAIRYGIAAAQPGDILLIAGKGHETYQTIGTRRIPFDDRVEAQNALAAIHRKVS